MTPANDDPLILRLEPLQDLPPQYQRSLIQAGEVIELVPGEMLFRQGSRDEFAHFLLEGAVALSKDGNYLRDLDAPSEIARQALDEPGVRPYSAIARRVCRVFRIEQRHLHRQRGLADTAPPARPPEVEHLDDNDPTDDWLVHVIQRGIFRNLSAEAVHRILSRIEEFSLQAGEAVITQGDVGEFYYLIKEGTAEVRRRSSDSLSVHLAELGPGSGFGEEALVAGNTRNATVRMVTNGKLLRLSTEDFNLLLRPQVLRPLTLEAATTEITHGARWLDVRYPEAFKRSAHADATNIPLPLLRLQLRQLEPATTYIAYAEQPGLAAVANFILCERGFEAFYLNEPLVLQDAEPILQLSDTQGSQRLAALVQDIEQQRSVLNGTNGHANDDMTEQPQSLAPARWRARLEELLGEINEVDSNNERAPRLSRVLGEIERSIEHYLRAQRATEHASLFAVLEEILGEINAETRALTVGVSAQRAAQEQSLAAQYTRLSDLARSIAQQKVAIQNARRQLEQKLVAVEKAHRDALSLGAAVSRQLGELETLVPDLKQGEL